MMRDMSNVFVAFARALASQFHPRMLALLLAPALAALVLWGLLAWFAWAPLTAWLTSVFFPGAGVLDWMYAWGPLVGLGGLKGFVIALVAAMLLAPVLLVTTMLITALVCAPVVNRHLANGVYQPMARHGSGAVWGSLGNALWSSALFCAGYLITMPLWLLPPLGVIVPWLWWGWLTARVMRFDSLADHADAQERRMLIESNPRGYLLLGLIVATLNYVPPLFLLTPVLGALAFGHYSFGRLRELRAAPGHTPSNTGPVT